MNTTRVERYVRICRRSFESSRFLKPVNDWTFAIWVVAPAGRYPVCIAPPVTWRRPLGVYTGWRRVNAHDVVRSHRSYSWPRPSNRNDGPSTPEGISENQELRLRQIERLDETAKSIDGFEMGTQWWIWRNPFTKDTAHRW
jgi:hypothetical protein